MAAAVTEIRKIPTLRSIRSVGTITLSGSYATGGETVPFVKPGTTKAPYNVWFNSVNGNQYFWDVTNQKMKAFSGHGTELSAGAYPAGYTSDVITYEAEYPRGG